MGDGIHNNSDAGLFQLVLDGSVLNSFDVGHIGPTELLHRTLTGTALVAAGMHTFEIDILRPFQSGRGITPYEFMTGASVSEVPEPSTLAVARQQRRRHGWRAAPQADAVTACRIESL